MTKHTNTRRISTDPGRFFPGSVTHNGVEFLSTGKLGYIIGPGTAVAEYNDPWVEVDPGAYQGRVWADMDGNITPE